MRPRSAQMRGRDLQANRCVLDECCCGVPLWAEQRESGVGILGVGWPSGVRVACSVARSATAYPRMASAMTWKTMVTQGGPQEMSGGVEERAAAERVGRMKLCIFGVRRRQEMA